MAVDDDTGGRHAEIDESPWSVARLNDEIAAALAVGGGQDTPLPVLGERFAVEYLALVEDDSGQPRLRVDRDGRVIAVGDTESDRSTGSTTRSARHTTPSASLSARRSRRTRGTRRTRSSPKTTREHSNPASLLMRSCLTRTRSRSRSRWRISMSRSRSSTATSRTEIRRS